MQQSFEQKLDLAEILYQKTSRGIGPFGPDMVRKYTSARFGSYSTGQVLNEEESKLLLEYVYHTLAAKASGELCLKYIFAFGAFTWVPLLESASEWKVPTTFIYGYEDWMSYEGAQDARKHMKVPCEIIRVPQHKGRRAEAIHSALQLAKDPLLKIGNG